jgi:hypothetical protein
MGRPPTLPYPDTGAAERGHQASRTGRYAERIGEELRRRDLNYPPRDPRRREFLAWRRPVY